MLFFYVISKQSKEAINNLEKRERENIMNE